MSGASVWSTLAALVLGGGGSGAIVAYIKDHKKTKAEGQVAASTVELQVDAARMQNLESRFALAERAWDAERVSFQARIERLEGELHDERLESERKEAKILALEERLATIQTEIQAMTAELAELRSAS